ncbi:MAG: hypothetical protein AABN95_22855 [Acidobacteriota bacterium]
MKRLTMAIALACLLSVSALAGQIPCDLTSPGPDAPTSTTSPGDTPTSGVAGDIPCDGFAQQAEDAAFAGFLAVVGWLI